MFTLKANACLSAATVCVIAFVLMTSSTPNPVSPYPTATLFVAIIFVLAAGLFEFTTGD